MSDEPAYYGHRTPDGRRWYRFHGRSSVHMDGCTPFYAVEDLGIERSQVVTCRRCGRIASDATALLVAGCEGGPAEPLYLLPEWLRDYLDRLG